MKDFDQEIREALAKEPVPVPPQVHSRTEELLRSLPEKETRRRLHLLPRAAALAASVLCVLLVLLPNISGTYAQAMSEIPGIGAIVQIFTIRTDFFRQNNHELEAQIPAVRDAENPGASDLINRDVDELTGEVIRMFYEELDFSEGQGHGAIHIDYEVLTSTPEWFTMKLSVEETRGSTNSYARYYHIDRIGGRYVRFGDLFAAEDFPVLETMIREQMDRQMEEDSNIVYLRDSTAGGSFTALDHDQGYYFEPDGSLVIVYDRYEIAPGFMGCPEFRLSRAEYEPYLIYPAAD